MQAFINQVKSLKETNELIHLAHIDKYLQFAGTFDEYSNKYSVEEVVDIKRRIKEFTAEPTVFTDHYILCNGPVPTDIEMINESEVILLLTKEYYYLKSIIGSL